MKTLEGPGLSWPIPHTTPFFLPPEDPYPVLLRPNSTPQRRTRPRPHQAAALDWLTDQFTGRAGDQWHIVVREAARTATTSGIGPNSVL